MGSLEITEGSEYPWRWRQHVGCLKSQGSKLVSVGQKGPLAVFILNDSQRHLGDICTHGGREAEVGRTWPDSCQEGWGTRGEWECPLWDLSLQIPSQILLDIVLQMDALWNVWYSPWPHSNTIILQSRVCASWFFFQMHIKIMVIKIKTLTPDPLKSPKGPLVIYTPHVEKLP